jgi:tRNA(Ile)-lysidine synthase
VLVGASGGADSTALLVALHSLAPEFGLHVHAAHLHHGLRGRDADRDFDAVAACCARLGVPLTGARWNTKRRMKNRGLSGQAGLRTLRREFLTAAARRAKATAIATAHTADDQLETLIMRLMRGSSIAGLAGMRPRNGAWIKPLLEATRHAIESDLERHGIAWREDLSNGDSRYLRSRIRHGVIPALIAAQTAARAGERAVPGRARARLASHAAEAAREIREAHDALRSLAKSRLVPEPTLAHFRAARPAVRRAALRECWRRASPAGPGLTRDHIEALLRLLERGREGARLNLPAGRTASLVRGRLHITTAAPVNARSRPPFSGPNGLRDTGDGKLGIPVAAKASH